MVPFMEFVHPETGRKQRVFWDRDRAHRKLEEFRAEASEYFRVQDIQRAKAAGLKIADDAPGLPTMALGPKDVMVIDPIAAAIKHSGLEFNDRWIPRWEEFCSKPQNDDGADYPVPTYKPRQAALSAALAQDKTATESVDAPAARRGPGRPPGSRNRASMANV